MTRLVNTPSQFAQEALEGFVAANRRWVRRVPGGVVRKTPTAPGHVAIIVGGGSGHYPAFSGLVGPGLAHGAVVGNVFASPSAHEVHSVAMAASAGGGVLLLFGNYAGDVLNFGLAQERLNAEGVVCRSLAVTDDISSAAVSEKAKRRGVAGDLAVFKVAAAASEAGHGLDEVFRLAELANERTRSFGIAFSGCTLPGAEAPLFSVPEGRMAIGLGIHGEPGIGEESMPTADELAELFVTTLLAELPPGITSPAGHRVGVILNGLGAVKYEELFVVYRRVAQLLETAGLEVVDPEVGELVTSFDMAGASLTLFWLDDELEPLWTAPANSPAFRKGAVVAQVCAISTDEVVDAEDVLAMPAAIPQATKRSQDAALAIVEALGSVRDVIDAHAEELGRLDAVAGDGDHGIGMQRGSVAAAVRAREVAVLGAGAGTTLQLAADAWAHDAGGTSGALWGVALRALGAAVGDQDAPEAEAVAEGVRRATAAVMGIGKAVPGDKTMVDVLVPFSEALTAGVVSGHGLSRSWDHAAQIAEVAAQSTATLLPRVGRARPHAERSLGTPDAGAVSLALIVQSVRRVIVVA